MRRTAAAAKCCAASRPRTSGCSRASSPSCARRPASLNQSLEIARASLDSLNLRAPVAGQLTSFDIQIGQSLQRGERLGQIDSAGRNKLRAQVDEFYLGRVAVGQVANAEVGGRHYRMRVSKIYPQVRNGAFEIDLRFVGAEPADLQRGQTVQTRLTLGDADAGAADPQRRLLQRHRRRLGVRGRARRRLGGQAQRPARPPQRRLYRGARGARPGRARHHLSLYGFRRARSADPRVGNEGSQSMLSMRELSRVYRTDTVETTALDGIFLDVADGEFVAIMGPSGCGKSTLLNVIGMLDSARPRGSYVFNGTEVAGLSESQARRFPQAEHRLHLPDASISSTSSPSARISSLRCSTTTSPRASGAPGSTR